MRRVSSADTVRFFTESELELIEYGLGCAERWIAEQLLGRPLTPGLAHFAQRGEHVRVLRELIASRGSHGSHDPDDPDDPNDPNDPEDPSTSTKALTMRTRFNNRLSVLEREHDSDFTIVIVTRSHDPITGKDEVTVSTNNLELSGRDAEIWLENNPADITIFDSPSVTLPNRGKPDTYHGNTI